MLKGERVEDDYVAWDGRQKQIKILNYFVEIASLTKMFLDKIWKQVRSIWDSSFETESVSVLSVSYRQKDTTFFSVLEGGE